MKRLYKQRILLNSEPFGFGPTAAIADFFPYFRDKFEHIAFIGGGHCLDLQKNLAYDAIYDISNKEITGNSFRQIASQYDVFFTACNFRRALITHSLNIPTIVYDPLSWYWKDIPEAVGKDIFYIAQDFFGVREFLENNLQRFPNTTIVPPIVENVPKERDNVKELVLVNLGGVQNPFWAIDVSIDYTRMMIQGLVEAFPQNEKVNLIIASSQKIAESLRDYNVQFFSREKMKELLQQTKYAIMTPGLSNIYDAALYNIPTLFLPPANDSQGLQVKALEANDMLDDFIDWHQIVNSSQFDKNLYYNHSQETILNTISKGIQELHASEVRNQFVKLCKSSLHNIMNSKETKTKKILLQFDSGGASKVVEAVCGYLDNLDEKM